MSSNKGFTNVNFTKRVDHEAGSHRPALAPAEPMECESCHARYEHRRWTAAADVHESADPRDWKPTLVTVCPACEQIKNQVPSGYLRVTGKFFNEYPEQIERLLRNEAERAGHDNPMARIMNWGTDPEGLNITTTTEHLVQRLGHALEKAFKGHVVYHFSHENKVARVNWHRD